MYQRPDSPRLSSGPGVVEVCKLRDIAEEVAAQVRLLCPSTLSAGMAMLEPELVLQQMSAPQMSRALDTEPQCVPRSVDDEFVNQEVMTSSLSDEYEVSVRHVHTAAHFNSRLTQ